MQAWINHLKVVLAGVLLVAIGAFMGASFVTNNGFGAGQVVALGEMDSILERDRLFAEVYQKVAPSVVAITVGVQSRQSGVLPTSSGTGFVVDSQGHIVTNYHVVEGADRLEINFFDGTITNAEIVGLDPDSDLAVIKVNLPAERLIPIEWGDSSTLAEGQTALAIGSPFQNDWTLTSGIISALNRRIVGLNLYSIGGVIQTDAAINPGNSGGPLLNAYGQVIGVNSQIESETRQNSGIGFAIPSNLVKRVAETLIRDGRIEYSYLGIADEPINFDLMQAYNLPDNIRGAAVGGVRAGFPAALAGLQNPTDTSIDVITAVNGTPIEGFNDLVGYLSLYTSPNQTITLTVYRNGQVLEIPVTLVRRPAN